jgi:hypothetical protein
VVEMTTERIFNKKLTRLDLKFGDINWEKAMIKQYELEKDERIWRIFLNGYAKNGFIVFDEELLPREELLKLLEEFKPEIVKEKTITVQELIDDSMSWNRIFGKGRT